MTLNQADFDETYKLMTQLVQNKCVNPPGNELTSIKTIEAYLKGFGIDSTVIQTASNRGNLFAKLSGTDPKAKAILLGPSHVDVVPISNPDDWTTNPFGGEIKNGYMYGRGVLDMLFIVACQVVIFTKVAVDKMSLGGDLMLLIVSDEESGAEFGTKHFFENNLDLLGDLKQRKVYALTEGGGSVLYNKLLLLRTGERGVGWRKLVFHGRPGHGAFPYKMNNALLKASESATRLTSYMYKEMPTDISLARDYLTALAEFEPEVRILLEDEKNFKQNLENLYVKKSKLANSLFAITHLTLSPNVMYAGVKVNTVPGKAELEVDIRPLPNQNEDYIMYHLRKALGELKPEPDIIKLVGEDNVPNGSMSPSTPEESDFVSLIHKAVAEELPNVKIIPSIVGGGTDARFCRNVGIDAYGFAVVNPDLPLDALGPIHGIDERIDLRTIDLTLKCYYNLVNMFYL